MAAKIASVLHSLSEVLQGISQCFSAIAWPIALIVVLVLFREQFGLLFKRLRELTIFGDKGPSIMFDVPTGEVKPPNVQTTTPQMSTFAARINKEKPANIYWLASDIMTGVDKLIRRGSRADIILAFRQSNHHLKEIGLNDAPVQRKIVSMLRYAQESAENDWTDDRRAQYARDLIAIRTDVAKVIAASQPDFQAWPSE